MGLGSRSVWPESKGSNRIQEGLQENGTGFGGEDVGSIGYPYARNDEIQNRNAGALGLRLG